MSGLYKEGEEQLYYIAGMKKKYYPALLVLCIAACPIAAVAQKRATDFQLFSQVQGTWVMESKKGKLYEDWKLKDKTTLTGKSYYLPGKDTLIAEYHELVLKGDELFYMANPKNQNNHDQPVPFKLISSQHGLMIFENKAHDFPQRIAYHITPGTGKLAAWIEGDINGKPRKMEYFYTKLND